LAAAAAAQSEVPSVLDRVQNVDNPELGELIRVAVQNRESLYGPDLNRKLELIRKVTLSYTQIKLLDQQIAEVARKIKAAAGPPEMRYELLLAKTELEAKLAEELANLREVMGIVPKHAFDVKPVETLNTWIHLQVLGEGVYVLDGIKPFSAYWAEWRSEPSGLLSEAEALDYVRARLQKRGSLPMRIDIHHNAAMGSGAKDLRGKLVSLIREANAQMEVEVRLALITWMGSGESTFFLRGGTITTLYPAQVHRPDGAPTRLASGPIKADDLDQHILWRLTYPGSLPLRFRIVYDETSAALARKTADAISAVAGKLGVSEVVEVVSELVESVPEASFLGRWQAVTEGEIQTVNIQPEGVCILAMSEGTASPRAGTRAQGRWFLTTRGIIMDIKDKRDLTHYVYRGQFDEEGHLVIDRGTIRPHGNLDIDSLQPTIFEKSY
jgi:hypothetical protein